MPIASMIPYALAAYGGLRGYQQAKDSGATGLGRLIGGAAGAYGGYQLGNMIPGVTPNPAFSAQRSISDIGNYRGGADMATVLAKGTEQVKDKRGIIDILLKKQSGETDPLKVSALLAAGLYGSGAFEQGPTDVFTPTYNVGYADFAKNRPGYTYIDPTTGQEKEYSSVYIPEADPKNQGDFRMGPYAMDKTRLKTGGLAEIKKFNEGGINYLPSKVSHDENDANNYVRALGYVEDGSGNGDKDEDTMLAQLADGEFVTRADGVLGAGIIAGANPNSMKDMREKGAAYFYEQQKRYKRVFDLLKDSYGTTAKKN